LASKKQNWQRYSEPRWTCLWRNM